MLHVNFKKCICCHVAFMGQEAPGGAVLCMPMPLFSELLVSMSHVNFSKCPCFHVEFKGQESPGGAVMHCNVLIELPLLMA